MVLLGRKNIEADRYVEVTLSQEDIEGAGKATYQRIKEYIFNTHGVKVHSKEIALMKDRYNLKERENYNLSKKEEGSTQRCFSEEHQRLIEEAFRHFNMIGDLPKIIRQAVYELTTGISIQDDLSGDRS